MTTVVDVLQALQSSLSARLGVYTRPGGFTTPSIRILPVPVGWEPPVTGLEVLISEPRTTAEPLLNREYHAHGVIDVRIVAHGGVSLDLANRRVISLYPLATVRHIPEAAEYPAQLTLQIPTQ